MSMYEFNIDSKCLTVLGSGVSVLVAGAGGIAGVRDDNMTCVCSRYEDDSFYLFLQADNTVACLCFCFMCRFRYPLNLAV